MLEVSGNSGTDQWSVTYTGPGSPLGTTWTGSGWSSASCSVLLTNIKVYNSGSSLDIEFDYEVFAGGVSRITGSVSTAGGGSGPSYPGIIGVPFGIAGSAGASITGLPTYTLTSTYDNQATATVTASGGWRFKEPGSGTWVNLPMTLAPGSAPSISGGCTDPGVGAASALNTGSLSVTATSKVRYIRSLWGTITCDSAYTEEGECTWVGDDLVTDYYELETQNWSQSASVRGFPDLEKGIIRFNPDFKALWWRSEMPQTKRLGVASCDIDGVVTTTTQDVEVHPYQDTILQAVTGLTAAMEDTFGYPSYAPWSASGSLDINISYEPNIISSPDSIGCPPGTIIQRCDGTPPVASSTSASRSYTFPSAVGPSADMVGYQGHAEPLARYWNSWCNPHWSFGLVTDDWDVDASPETWNNYWKKVGSQWLNNAGASIAINTRNHLWSEALENDGNGPFLDSFFGGYRWIGQVRWQTKAVTPRSSFTYGEDQESLFESPDGTVSVTGTTITVTPP